MKIYISLFALVITLFISSAGYAQQQRQDSLKRVQPQKPQQLTPVQLKQKQQAFYRRTLNIDSVKAEEVYQIQTTYKSGMKLVVEDKTLSQELRRAKIKALMDEKNEKLQAILTPAQQAKIIPGTEREPGKGAKKD